MPSVLLSKSPFSVKALVSTVRDRREPGLLAGGAGSEQNMTLGDRPKGSWSEGSPAVFSADGGSLREPWPFVEKPQEGGVGNRDKRLSS